MAVVADLDPAPACGRQKPERRGRGARDDDREVGVPSERAQRGADRRVALRGGGGADPGDERLAQQRARIEPAAAAHRQPHHLRVGAEAAAGGVDRVQLPPEELERVGEHVRIDRRDLGRRPKRREACAPEWA
jgi:hypothetical protein